MRLITGRFGSHSDLIVAYIKDKIQKEIIELFSEQNEPDTEYSKERVDLGKERETVHKDLIYFMEKFGGGTLAMAPFMKALKFDKGKSQSWISEFLTTSFIDVVQQPLKDWLELDLRSYSQKQLRK